jgi:hypothetical protein
MTTAKWTINTGEHQDLHCPAARFIEKGCLLVWGGDALKSMHIAQFGKSFLEFNPNLKREFA